MHPGMARKAEAGKAGLVAPCHPGTAFIQTWTRGRCKCRTDSVTRYRKRIGNSACKAALESGESGKKRSGEEVLAAHLRLVKYPKVLVPSLLGCREAS